MDILIKNVQIIDGTGKPSYKGNVGIFRGKIVLSDLPEQAGLIIDGEGKYLVPGFIDAHSHGDMVVGVTMDYGDLCKINQGVTTQVTGQCGDTQAPYGPKRNASILPEGMREDYIEKQRTWTTFSKYMDYVEQEPKVTNHKMLVGHNAIRVAVMGYEDRTSTAGELEQMKALVKDAMESGVAGLSSGLGYVPGTYSALEEMVELVKVVKDYDGIYTTHIRNESKNLIPSLEEAIQVGRQTGVPVHISHFKARGVRNWGTHWKALELIENARTSGVDITCDQYPYDSTMTFLAPCIPNWYFTEGMEHAIDLLKDPAARKKIRQEMLDPNSDFENLMLNAGDWNGVRICNAPNLPEAEGLTVAEYAEKIGKDPFDAFFDMLIVTRGLGTAVYHSLCDDDVLDIIRRPYVMVGSDGIVLASKGKCHPRGWGTSVRAICHFCKETGVLPLEEVIYKMTGFPAQRYSLNGKGKIQEGYDADLVLMDYKNLKDRANYDTPFELAEGIEMVFVNGKLSYKDGALTGATAGTLIR